MAGPNFGPNLDLTAMNAALKEYYGGQVVENLVYRDNPFLAMVKKMTEFGGKYYPIPIITGVSQGRSSDFATAQTNQTPVQIQEFMLTRKSDYSIARIDNQTMEASRTDKMSFLRGAQTAIDGAIRTITLSIASALFRSGSGAIGRLTGAPSSGVCTLTDANAVVNFEVGQVLQCTNGTNETDAVRTSGSPLGYVIAVDRTAGTVTVATSANSNTPAPPTGWTTNNYLIVQGDAGAKPSGLEAWIPTTAPTSSTFYTVDRSVDPVRLGGVRYDGSAQSIEEALIDASMLVAREGGKPDVCVTSFSGYGALEKALGAKVQYIDYKGPADIAFRGIRINGHNSEIKVFPDRNCPSTKGYMLQMDTWTLYSLNDAPHILRYSDGNEMLRVANADAAEVRIAAYYNLGCNAPGWNANLTLAA
jgi:hypothetical protein